MEAPPPTARQLPAPGTDLGGIEVRRVLGQGGMGHILVGRDRALGREVALKFLGRGFLGDPRAERRFRREGRALAAMVHPHVVRVYGVGSWSGWPYLVMEFVEGTSLAARLRAGPLPLGEALRIGEELASALAEVHMRRILHRDVSPSNVMLRAGTGSVCLVDFGLARTLDTTTRSGGGVAGTLWYMAPEQMAGRRLDTRVDVYAFGATFFEALAGRPPHEADEQPALFHAVLNEDAPLLRTLRPEAPRALEVLLARCLSRAAEFRPADGEALLADFRAVRAAASPGPVEAAVAEGSPHPRTFPRDPTEAFPLLGAAREFSAIRGALEEAEAGRGSLLLVEGEAGSGKSRLLREAARAARARALAVIRCEGAEFPGSPRRAVLEALAAQGRSLGLSTTKAVLGRVREVSPGSGPVLPALRWFLEGTSGDPGAAPSPAELARAVSALLRALLHDRPALLAADDAHLLDAGSLDLLAAAATEAGSWPLVLVLAFRPPAHQRANAPLAFLLPRLRAVPGARAFVLPPLSEGAVASLVHLALRVDEAEACRLAPLLHRRSGGNPLYLTECLRLLEEEGKIVEDRSGRRLRHRVSTLALPPRLREIALRRVVGLPARERDVLGAVSIDPAGLPADLVARCLDTTGRQALRILQNLVVGRGLASRTEKGFAVPHAEIREEVYADLIPELRAAYHAEAARFLEESGAAAAEPARLARHFRRAGQPAKAVPLLVAEGKRSLSAGASSDALFLFEEALVCSGPGGDFEASYRRAIALDALGDSDAAISELKRLAASFEGPNRLDALLQVAAFEQGLGRPQDAWKSLRGVLEDGLDADRRIRLYNVRMAVASQLGRFSEVEADIVKAKALAPAARPETRLNSWMAMGSAEWRRGRFREAKESWDRALGLAEEVGNERTAASLLCNLSLVSADLGDAVEAIELARKAAERSTVLGATGAVLQAHQILADLLIGELLLDKAEESLDEVDGYLALTKSQEARALFAARRADLALARGDGKEAAVWADRGYGLASSIPRHAAGFRLCRAEARLLSGDAEGALADAREARIGHRELGMKEEEQDDVAIAAAALRTLGRRGAERSELPSVGAALTWRAAAEAAFEALEQESRDSHLQDALRLARNRKDRRDLARIAGIPPGGRPEADAHRPPG